MIIIKILSGNSSVPSLHASLPQSLNTDQCENITPFRDDFILSMSTARIAATIVKKSLLSLNSNLG